MYRASYEPTYAHVVPCLASRRLGALGWWVKVKINCASGGPAQRAGGQRCSVAVLGGWPGPVGCSLRLSPEATRNLPGAQPAVVWQGAVFYLRRLHSRQNHWLGFAGQAKGAPDLGSKSVRCASAPVRAHRSGWWVSV